MFSSDLICLRRGELWAMEAPTRTLANLLTQCDVLVDIEIEKRKNKEAAEAKLAAEIAEKERQERLT